MGKFVITKKISGQYHFDLKAANGETILTSQNYTSKANCENGMDSVAVNSLNDSSFERIETEGGKFYFNLKAANGEIIGTSELYPSKAGMEKGIALVRVNAQEAVVEDMSVERN